MPVVAADIRLLYTTATGPGNSQPQPDPGASLGGYASHTPWSGGLLHDFFGPLTEAQIAVAAASHRCVYVVNNHATEAALDVRAYLTSQTPGGCDLDVGLDPAPASALGQAVLQATRITSELEGPPGVSFVTPGDYASGVVLGTLAPGMGRSLWVRRRPTETPNVPIDAATLVVAFPKTGV